MNSNYAKNSIAQRDADSSRTYNDVMKIIHRCLYFIKIML